MIRIETITDFSRQLLLVAGGACCLLWLAIYNGYPLAMRADTNHFLKFYLTNYDLTYRSGLYGYYLIPLSVGYSLWIPVTIQAFLFSFLIFNVCLVLFENSPAKTFIFAMIVVSFFTSASSFLGKLHPDAFMASLFLAIFLLLFQPRSWKWGLYIAVTILASSNHLGFLPPTIVFVGSVLLFRKRCRVEWAPIQCVIISLLCGTLLIPLTTFLKGNGFTLPKDNGSFFAMSLAHKGLFEPVVKKRCNFDKGIACDLLTEMENWKPPREFVWAIYRPLIAKQKQADRQIFRNMISETSKEALFAYPIEFCLSALKEFFTPFGYRTHVLKHISNGYLLRFKLISVTHMKKYLLELNAWESFLKSKQIKQSGAIHEAATLQGTIQWYLLQICVVVLLLVFTIEYLKGSLLLTLPQRSFLGFAAIFLLVNRLLISVMMGRYFSRYEDRVTFLIIFFTVGWLIQQGEYFWGNKKHLAPGPDRISSS